MPPPPLRYSIPGLIVLAGAGLSVVIHLTLLHRSRDRALSDVLNVARGQASRLAGLTARAMGHSDLTPVSEALHNLTEDADLKYAVVIDPADTVIASMRELWNARPMESTAAADAIDLVASIRATRAPQTLVIRGKDLVIAGSPVTGSGEPVPRVALVERDLSNADEAAIKHAFGDALAADLGIAGFCLVLWAAQSLAIAPRARRTLEAATRAETGAEPAPALPGHDEFSRITGAIARSHQRLLDQSRGIRERDERLLRLIDMLPSMVLIVREDRIESINRAGIDMLGARTPDQVIGRSPFEIVHPDSQAAVSEKLRGLQRTGASAAATEEKFLKLDGSPLEVEWVASPFRDALGPGLQIVARDLSEKKAGEATRAELSRNLEEKNKELEAIVYAASHDLRSPLLNVMGFSRQLAEACHEIESALDKEPSGTSSPSLKPLTSATIPRALRFIEQGVAKMDALISGFLQYSRSGRQEIDARTLDMDARTLDMDALLRSTTESLTYQIQEGGVDVRLEKLPPCHGDAMQIAQVFTNLLDNAMKYRKPDAPCVIAVQGHRAGASSVYTVTDNGLGIAREHQRQIFDIFHRLDPAGSPGEGLGLTIARRIVQRHGGAIDVESQPGAGSTFTVTLPAPP